MNLKNTFLLSTIMLILIISVTSTLAQIPTQQSNKILLEPFYVNSMTRDIKYNYNVSIITPDGISKITSAIITLDAWINPTRTFNAWMNDIQCNTKNYTISTTYANAGRGVITFDCTNAIIPNKLNNVTFIVTGGNIGSSTSWIDITYMNNPVIKLDVYGTEYAPYDNGTIFLSLNSDDISNSMCDVTVWYPNKSIYINDVMSFLNTSESLFYIDLIVPNINGVYMIESSCYLPLITGVKSGYYDNNSNYEVISNDTIVSNQYYSFGIFDSGDGFTCYKNSFNEIPIEFFGIDTPRYINNITSHNIYLWASGNRNAYVKSNYYKINYATGISTLLNTTLSNLISVTTTINNYTLPNAVIDNYFTSYEVLSIEHCILNTGGNQEFRLHYGTLYPSNLTFNTKSINISQSFTYRGTGEIHVSNLYSNINSSINNISYNVWNFNNRNLTYYEDVTNYSIIEDSIYSLNNSINDKLNTIINDINNLLINLTQQIENVITYILSVPYNVWVYSTRNLTYYPEYPIINDTNYTKIVFDVWNYDARYTHGVVLT